MKSRIQQVLLVVALLVCLIVAGALVAKQSGDRAAAAESADRFASATPQTVPSAAPVIVTIIGDDLASPAQSGRPVTEWPVLLQRAVSGKVVSLSTAGSGYTTRPLTSLYGGTFAARAQQAASTSKVVLIMGGANDQRSSRVALLRAASDTISNAQKAAPRAQVVVVGPPDIGETPSSTLLVVRDALREAASRGDARFVDPIAQGWFDQGTGYLGQDERSLTAKGERVIATRIGDVLRTLL